MVQSCCIPHCKMNRRNKKNEERNSENVSFYRFPNTTKKKARDDWIQIVNEKCPSVVVTKGTVICSLHWPINAPMVRVHGKEKPDEPPSINLEVSRLRNRHRHDEDCDELKTFRDLDKLDFDSLKKMLLDEKKTFDVNFERFFNNDTLYLQSETFIEGIPCFMIKVFSDLKYEAFHVGVKILIPSLHRNRIYKLLNISTLDEMLRYLSNKEIEHKSAVLLEQMKIMKPSSIGSKLYSAETIIRAFEYFSTSRALYSKLRHDYALPSVSTLTRITSKVGKIDESSFLSKVFQKLSMNEKVCSLIFDEVYVKKALLYHGGSIFGKAVNYPTELASSVLGVLIASLHGGPVFLNKMLPVVKLNAEFMMAQLAQTISSVDAAGGNIKVLICDNNRTNQKLFKSLAASKERPWVTKEGKYLLFDFVHLIKSIRNNWITEKTKELIFVEDGIAKIAKWSHLEKLYELESKSPLTKLSKLNEISVYPKPIERQKVSICLNVFCEKTRSAILHHPGMSDVEGREDTAAFLNAVITFFTIMNVKSKGANMRHNNYLEDVISSETDERLDLLCKFGDMVYQMKPSSKQRVKQLTNDTANAVHKTCHGIVDLCKNLLSTSHNYVCLGKFTSDLIEKEFSKLRQGSGGTYFITVQAILEKLNIQKSSLLLSLKADIAEFKKVAGHECPKCTYRLNEQAVEIFDDLEKLESHMPIDTKMALVYISGYVTRNDLEKSEDELLSVTTFYHQKYGGYSDELDRGMLNIPHDSAVQWTIFCSIMFEVVKNSVCKVSLANIFHSVSEYYNFGMTETHSKILSNIFLKNFCLVSTPRSSKETTVKVMKLSN